MELKLFDAPTHYEEVCRWWTAHDWPHVPLSHLPCGYVVLRDGKPACIGFIYYTGTAFCLFEWITVNPAVRRQERAEALDFLFESVKAIVKGAGVSSIFMSLKSGPLIGRLEKHGFTVTDTRMTNLIGGS